MRKKSQIPVFQTRPGIMHFTNRAFVLSADDAVYADKNQEDLRSSVKSADPKHKSLSSAKFLIASLFDAFALPRNARSMHHAAPHGV
jgi:hypothetical protein